MQQALISLFMVDWVSKKSPTMASVTLKRLTRIWPERGVHRREPVRADVCKGRHYLPLVSGHGVAAQAVFKVTGHTLIHTGARHDLCLDDDDLACGVTTIFDSVYDNLG